MGNTSIRDVCVIKMRLVELIKRIFGIKSYEKELAECNLKTLLLEEKIKKLEIMPLINQFEEFWNSKKPKADIFYQGRSIPTDINVQVSIDVRSFIILNDSEIFNDLRQNSLLVEQNPTMPLNDLILKIYKHTRIKPVNPYNYEFDDQAFKIGELWLFPFELRHYKQGDCDDWAIELASYLIQAGIPYWRVRCVAGTTWNNFGHLTVYALADDMKSWHHLNSTTPISMITANKLEDLPKSNDPNDGIGIKDCWFSFNNVHAWHVFETSGAEDGFSKVSDFIAIKPKGVN